MKFFAILAVLLVAVAYSKCSLIAGPLALARPGIPAAVVVPGVVTSAASTGRAALLGPGVSIISPSASIVESRPVVNLVPTII